MQPTQLSRADSKVLLQVFDPESAPDRVEVIVDPDLPADPHIYGFDLLEKLRRCEMEAISIVEEVEKSQGDTASRDEAYRSALNVLDQLVFEHPNYASARNNRAQLRRWRFGDRDTICQRASRICLDRSREALAAVRDLMLSIELSSPARPQDAVSPSQGRLLAQSYTQLAAIYYAAAKDMDTTSIVEVASLDQTSWTKDRFEEEASRCFYLGGLYGNQAAKALAVHTNPHAKLCGAIVQEAMQREIVGG